LEMMANIAGYHIEVRVNPAFVRANEISRLVGSNKRLVDDTGWRRQYELQQTLMWMHGAG